MTAPVTTQWTVEAIHAMPGGGLDFEVVDGRRHRLAFHTVSHENGIALLTYLLAGYIAAHSRWELRRAPTELVVTPRTLLRPDVMLLLRDGSTSGSPPPILVVEVLSPSTAGFDRGSKRILYQRLGVGELWLVDLDREVVERWRAAADAAEVLRERLVWHPDPALAAFEMFLPAFFSEVHLDD